MVRYILTVMKSGGTGQTQGTVCSTDEEQPHGEAKGMTITSLLRIPRFHTFSIKGGVQGQQFMILIDGGATHNFIDSILVRRLGLPTIDIGDFKVLVIGRHSLACTQRED
jgi:predicted aspartyl protease